MKVLCRNNEFYERNCTTSEAYRRIIYCSKNCFTSNLCKNARGPLLTYLPEIQKKHFFFKALRDKKAAARRRNMESDEEPDDVLDNQVGKMSVENDWWRQFIEPQDLKSLLPSNKLRILFEILKLCQQNGEKW